jgi:hypothetical protein
MKRYFLINTGRYGGELTVGNVTPEFVDYWKERVENDGDSDLIGHMQALEWGDMGSDEFDPDSPQIDAEHAEILWHECDDLEHLNGPYADNQYTVTEITLSDNVEMVNGVLDWTDDKEHCYSESLYTEADDYDSHDYDHYVYGRECYSTDPGGSHIPSDAELAPVLFYHSSEKGGFGEIIVETDGSDFNPDLLSIGVCETDLGTIIEAYWYDGTALEINFDFADTNGKGYYAGVGYVNTKWHDTTENYTPDSDFVKEALEELYFQDAGC